MNGYAVTECRVADLRATAAVHRQTTARFGDHLDGALRRARLTADHRGEPGSVRSTDNDAGAQPGTGEGGASLVGDETSGVERDHVVGRTRGLLGVAGGVEDRPAPGGMGTEQPVQPVLLVWESPSPGSSRISA